MYKTGSDAAAFIAALKPLVANATASVVVCAPFTALHASVESARYSNIQVGAQDLFWLKEGAYTGEVSGPMLASAGCQWVIVGHSERRQYFGETDETVFKKTLAALDAGLNPIVCVGERLEDREAGETETVLATQFFGGLSGLSHEQFERIVIAYEPVWAIGTGKTATPGIASAAHSFIRGQASAHFGEAAAGACRILYGGSVNPGNIAALMAEEELDGALVGGASLDATSFATIVTAACSS
jgi:triosephosphate isomerase